MYYAIETTYLGPTNTLGARIKATWDRHTLTRGYIHSLSASGGHRAVALALLERYRKEKHLRYEIVAAGITTKGYVFIVEFKGAE